MSTNRFDRRCANLIANLIAFRPGRRTNARDQIGRTAAQGSHLPDDGRDDLRYGGPPGSMSKTDGAMPPVGNQHNGAVTALAKQRQAVGGGHQPISRADTAPFPARQDASPMDLIQKGHIGKAQHSSDLSTCGRRVVLYEVHIGTLPRRNEVGNAESLQRHEATHPPPVGQRL